MEITTDDPNIDRGKAWIILVSSFFGMFVFGAFMHGTGVYTAAILEHLTTDISKASWVGSTQIAMMHVPGPLCGIITSQLGCGRTTFLAGIIILVGMIGAYLSTSVTGLTLTAGVIAGFGIGLVLNTSNTIVGHYFIKRRVLASAIAMSGSGMGLLVTGVMVQLLTDKYGVQGAYLIQGAFGFNACVLGYLMKPSAIERNKSNRDITAWKSIVQIVIKYRDIVTNVSYMSYLMSFGCLYVAENIAVVHLANYVIYKGSTTYQAASLFTVKGLGSLSGRLLMGVVASDPRIKPEILHTSIMGVLGSIYTVFPVYSDKYGLQLIFALACGLYSGALDSLITPISVDYVGVTNLAYCYGLLALLIGISAVIGPPLAATLVKSGLSYDICFILGGGAFWLGCCLGFGMMLTKPKNNNVDMERRREKEQTQDLELTLSVPGMHDSAIDALTTEETNK
ncbi:monocarboxylate transporter 2 [Patella vulgata]|uniref:monocarboxylate transporter 2 n=1 Tax=Patella vulgata TaxID=6465 RepID=UPI002180562E|nr:monocarboxylate transporter 2 [Patella vulgata]